MSLHNKSARSQSRSLKIASSNNYYRINFMPYSKFLLLTSVFVVSLFASCSKNNDVDVTPTTETTVTAEAQNRSITPTVSAPTACTTITNDACGTATNKSNCVLYARCKVPSLPTGLTSYASKLAIIRTQTASVGRVAICQTSSTYGHVAVVVGVSGSTITLRESNYCGTYISERSGTKSALSIQGYY
jgi:hypothetical protein